MGQGNSVVPLHRTVSFQAVGFAFGFAVLAACLWYLLLYLTQNSGKVLDDSYITYTYARNLAEGAGLRYNPADLEPTEGGTSFLHMVIAATGIRLGIDPLTTTRAVSLVAFFAAIAGLAHAITVLTRSGAGIGFAAASVAGALVVMLPETGGHFGRGLETIIFFSLHLALAAWAMLAVFRSPNLKGLNALTGGILATLVAMSRPEGVLIAGAILVLAIIFAAKRAGSLRTADAGTAIGALLLFALAICSFLIWKVWYFGDMLPNAYWVKSNNRIFGGADTTLPGLRFVFDFMSQRFAPIALVIGALFVIAGTKPSRVVAMAAVALPALVVALLYSKAIHEVAGGHRYGFPMLAPLILLLGLSLAHVLRRHPELALAGCAVGLMGMTTINSGPQNNILTWASKPLDRATAWVGTEPQDGPLEKLAHDLKDTGLGEQATIYLSAAGLIPYISRYHAIDWIGLNNNTLSGANAMSLDEVWSYIHSTQPDIIQTVVPPALPGSTSRFEDAAFNSPAVKDLLRGRVKLFYYWDREIVAEMLWREMLWIRDHTSMAACYDLRGSWTLFAFVVDKSPHARQISDTLAKSTRAGCHPSKTRADYGSDPFRGQYLAALR